MPSGTSWTRHTPSVSRWGEPSAGSSGSKPSGPTAGTPPKRFATIGKAAMAGTIVVDTSVLIKWIKSRDEELVPEARKLLEQIEKRSLQVVVPALLLYEIGNILLLKTRLDSEELALAL